jgi:hypothetical protein|tara:strand:+ start:12777 stop:13688 length:912 start_codon:yes stop_codon:yes gene_type:complete
MRKLFLALVTLTLFGTVSASTVSNQSRTSNSFVFNEQGIEFAIFNDGQFDFNVPRQRQNFIQFSNHNGLNISFNTGYDYSAYVQYDSYGAVIQIENTPIYYDYYGRISQAGNVHVNYDYRGRVSWIGNMRINYDRYNNSLCNGYVNRQHRYYTPSAWYSYYSVPNVQYCVIFKTPYRRHYTPVRYQYQRPYRNNSRPNVYRNQRGQNRVANSRSNHSDRYKTNQRTRRSVNNSTRSENRQTTRATTRSSTNQSNNSVATSNRRVRKNTPNQVKRNKAVTRNSRVVAQRTPRVNSKRTPVRRRK